MSIIDRERWLGPPLIGPAVVYMCWVGLPFLMLSIYSVSNTTPVRDTGLRWPAKPSPAWSGTPRFQTALKNTLVFALLSQTVILVLSNARCSHCKRIFAASD